MRNHKGARAVLQPLHLPLVQLGGKIHVPGSYQFLNCEGQNYVQNYLDYQYVLGLREEKLRDSGNKVVNSKTWRTIIGYKRVSIFVKRGQSVPSTATSFPQINFLDKGIPLDKVIPSTRSLQT